MSTINNTMGEGSTSTRDMSTDKINVDLNEYPIEDISLENGYSGTVSEHFDHDIVANDVLEVEEIETYEKENIVSSSQNIEINEFAEEVDRDETYNETNIVPFVGQIFLSEEEAFAFYKRYAYQHGFSVRKGRFIKRNGIMRRRDFFCHREGRSSLKIIEPLKEQRNRESTRCECKAYLRISLQKSHDIFPSEWRVTKFVVEHNHVLLTQSEVRFLPANRTISEDDIERIFLLKEGGLSVRQLMRVIELEKNVKHGYLPFIERDIRNLFVKTKKKVERNDAKDLLKYCEDAKKSCSKFQYAYTLDEERRLEHIFWSPASCSDWYQKYGDVVVFDTTYKVNSYEMPFGIFVGMNSHGKTVLFGCALLRNETISAFRWLMKTFISLMKKPPKTILTDQDPWMKEAISKDLPSTKHSFCIWHITFKFSSWFNAILRDKYSKWCSDFYELYKLETCEEFEHQWPKVVAKYNLQSNKHVKGLYEIRNYWALAYLRDHFFGGMTTTGRSESINAFIKRFINSHTSLSDFTKQVDVAIDDIKQKEDHDIMLEKCKRINLKLMSPLQEQAHGVLTRFAFQKFQEEFERSTQYSIHHENGNEFVLRYYKDANSRKHMVFGDGKIATCSCKYFEFWGILCRHILSIFLHKDCHEIPSNYLPSRWRLQTSHDDDEVDPQQVNVVFEEQVDVVHCPPPSKTKGRPKRRRLKDGKELSHNMNTCGLCKDVGHNIVTCPLKENTQFSGHTNKKKKICKDANLNPILLPKV
ncbi:hypothetical protein JHK85_049719 [Glycine max]|nr:hypothetical protein JHK85_049719 [Glycine max]